VSYMVAVEAGAHSRKRLRRTAEEKRCIVEAPFVAGASIARVAREHGVDANQGVPVAKRVSQGNPGCPPTSQTKLVPVTVTAEPNRVTLPGIAPVTAPSGSIDIELPGRAVISVEAGVDPELVRTALGSLLR